MTLVKAIRVGVVVYKKNRANIVSVNLCGVGGVPLFCSRHAFFTIKNENIYIYLIVDTIYCIFIQSTEHSECVFQGPRRC